MTLPSLGAYLLGQPIVLAALFGLITAAAGWLIEQRQPGLGQRLRFAGYLVMLGAGALIAVDAARRAEHSDAKLNLVNQAETRIEGGETIIPLGADGHYHVMLQINGREVPAMIDTGASYTSLEQAAAATLDLDPDPGRLPSELSTANGVILAHFAVARELRVGNILVREAEIAVTPNTAAPQALVGMNLLSKLASWRVERGELHLVPAP